MIKIDFKQRKREVLWTVVALFFIAIGVSVFKFSSATSGFEITDELGGNIFPSAILSVATTDAQVIQPADSIYLGNPKSCIAIKVKSRSAYSRVRIDVAETPFFHVRCRSSCSISLVRNIPFIPISFGTTKR